MSKTDKDRPWLIRAADRLDAGSAAYFRHSDYAHARGECDADVDPIERYKAGNNFSNYSSCGWTLPYSYFVSPPTCTYVGHGPGGGTGRRGAAT